MDEFSHWIVKNLNAGIDVSRLLISEIPNVLRPQKIQGKFEAVVFSCYGQYGSGKEGYRPGGLAIFRFCRWGVGSSPSEMNLRWWPDTDRDIWPDVVDHELTRWAGAGGRYWEKRRPSVCAFERNDRLSEVPMSNVRILQHVSFLCGLMAGNTNHEESPILRTMERRLQAVVTGNNKQYERAFGPLL